MEAALTNLSEYADDYRDALEHFIDGAGEGALTDAYEIGRRALASGLGILDLASLHHEAVARLLQREQPQEPASLVRAVANFFFECLSPFEISHRGIDEANAALRRLNELLEADAKRIAHALHDQAGSIIASAGLELDLAATHLPTKARKQLALVRRLLDETGNQLRHLSHELRPTLLDDLGLGPALEYLAEGFEQRSTLRVNVEGGFRERLPAAVEIAIYRIVQEALNNTLLHAGESSRVTVSMERRDNQVYCTITDDGAGFDVDAILADGVKRGLGLLGMRERASAVGGTCEITSRHGRGTAIEIAIPVEAPAPSDR